MGALTYSPAINLERVESVIDFDRLQQIALEVLKEQQDNDAELLLYNSGNSGGARPKAVFEDFDGHWIIKFRHTYDPTDVGIQEYRYDEMAQKCGIIVPDFRLVNGRYFTSRRFDIDSDGNRLHTATAGGLMCISLSEPFMDYSNLLALTGYITQSGEDVEQMYRRMLFNYFTDNKDDHCNNFSFYVIKDSNTLTWRWRLAPAYDLTLCIEGYNGEHATSVNGTGHPALIKTVLWRLVFSEAALEEAGGGEDEKEGAGSLHECYCVEGCGESDILCNHASKQNPDSHSQIP